MASEVPIMASEVPTTASEVPTMASGVTEGSVTQFGRFPIRTGSYKLKPGFQNAQPADEFGYHYYLFDEMAEITARIQVCINFQKLEKRYANIALVYGPLAL
jgi:hypothetical protein